MYCYRSFAKAVQPLSVQKADPSQSKYLNKKIPPLLEEEGIIRTSLNSLNSVEKLYEILVKV
jgi:hypothetical protein